MYRKDLGACHTDDLMYVFPMKLLPKAPANETDIKVSNFLTKHIANFAQTGNPTPNNDEEDDTNSFVWPLFKSCENDIVMIEKDGNVVFKKDKEQQSFLLVYTHVRFC